MAVRNRPGRALVLGTLWILTMTVTACESTTEPEGDVRRLGTIVMSSDDPQVVVPDTVQAGVEFVLEVTTYGTPFDRKGETEVVSSGNRAVITPFDYLEERGSPDVLVEFVHQANVEFSEPGLAYIVIQGYSGGGLEDGAVEIEFEVVVEP